MKPAFEYKNYCGSAEVSVEDNLLVGKLLFIQDVISYTASTPVELEAAFREAVDDYLNTCDEIGDEPNQPFKGTFNVRVGQDRHRSAALEALKQDVSLNEWVCQAIDEKLMPAHTEPTSNHFTVNYYVQHPTTERRVTSSAGPDRAWSLLSTTPAHSPGTRRTDH